MIGVGSELPARVLDRGVGLHLQQRRRRHPTEERAIVRRDQQDADCDGGREQSQRDGGRRPVVAVDHGDRRQRAHRLSDQRQPLHPVHRRLADENALATRVERLVECGDDFSLCGRLSVTADGLREHQRECLTERGGDHRQRSAVSRHGGPLHFLGILDVPADEAAHPNRYVSGKR